MAPDLDLTERDRAMLDGTHGDAASLAMRIVTKSAEIAGATHLLDITSAHIDGCLFHGMAGLDFARRLRDAEAQVAVPSTLNVSALDLLHPELVRLDATTSAMAREQMDAYLAMGCRPTWTCAPYQSPERPSFGDQIAWAESNAIVFANSVLGARTERYGDFIDVCCAITGRAPAVGLHLDEHRGARVVFRVEGVPDRLLADPVAHAAIGLIVGREAGALVPAVVGLPTAPTTSEDHLKAMCAAAASSGSVALIHVIGVTPEAPTLEAAIGEGSVASEVRVGPADLRAARDAWSTVGVGAAIGAVSVGTPHMSVAGFERLASLADGRRFAVPFYVNTGRDVLRVAEGAGTAAVAMAAGATMVTDTCTYITPVIAHGVGPVVTDSAKWAWYAPSNLGVEVAIASLEECIRSAVEGGLVRDDALWGSDG
ncbi:MAG TPA: aconitase X catalytic domain-containing protein [Actinomycetota bacterium]